MKEKYRVGGMSCAACSSRVERAVSSTDGVTSCSVNLLTGEMTVEGNAGQGAIEEAVKRAGYSATRIVAEGDSGAARRAGEDQLKDTESPKLLARLIASLGFVIVLMYFSMGHMFGAPLPRVLEENPIAQALIQLLLSMAVIVINQKFFINGTLGLIRGAPNMDTLVALGSAVSFGYSVYQLFEMSYGVMAGADVSHYLHGLYFEAAAMIVALITLGKFLEAKAKGRTTDALRSLLELKPKAARLLFEGEEREVEIDRVKVGDLFVVRAGDSIPTDGEVVSGDGAIDEAALSGESLPVDKSEGDSVYGATMCKSGYLVCRVTKIGEQTAISGIIRMVKEASSSKAPIAKLADRVSGVFVPIIIFISLMTLIGWLIARAEFGFAVARAISVLVISCPCALGLATPVAIMVGSGVGARRGILFKNATALEEAGRVKTVILDKTGTVTKGEMSVTFVSARDEDELLSVAYSLEYMSEHPLGRAVVKYAEEHGAKRLDIDDFTTLSGRGVSGKLGEDDVYGASYDYAKTLIKLDISAEEEYKRLAFNGSTPLVFIKGGVYLGMIAVADTLKDDAKDGVSALISAGLDVVMLTGDNERTARAIADEVGISHVVAGVLPDGKEAVIRKLCEEGKVAMVGDGINDAPALTRANVGIAVGRGTDIAIESADVVLLGDRLTDVATAIGIGRSTLWNIRENLAWAFVYNLLGIPMAAGLFGLALNPMFGALAMSLSSLSVVLNALRLNLFKPKHERRAKKNPSVNNGGVKISESEVFVSMTKIIKVSGMMCSHCEGRVKKALEAIDGVAEAVPSHEDGSVKVNLSCDVADEALRAAIADAGYEVLDIG